MCPGWTARRDREEHSKPSLSCSAHHIRHSERGCSLVIRLYQRRQINDARHQPTYGLVDLRRCINHLCIFEFRVRALEIPCYRDMDPPRYRPSRPGDRTCIDV